MCSFQPFGIRAIADHRRDAAGQFRFQQRLHVAAAPGNENDDIFHVIRIMLFV